MDYRYEENNYPKAFLATGLIMAVLAALCYFIVFTQAPKVDDGTGGILVNYGTTDEGMGKDILSAEETSAAAKPNHVAPTKVTPAPATEQAPQPDNSDKKIVTQDAEDAPVVAANSKKPSSTVAQQTVKAAPKPTLNQNALYKGAPKTGSGGGDGTTNKAGNQGSTSGSTLSDNYGPGGSGNGLNLPHWQFVNPPDVKNINRVPGVVVIDFTIDETGHVFEAHSNKQKTRAGLDLVQSCVDAIYKSSFKSSAPASGNQRGEMSFIFKVD